MFGLFGKKETKNPEEQIIDFQKKRNWAGLAKAYYQLGKEAMENGDLNRAQLWLHRADTIYSARDEVYEAVGEQITEDCSERIGQLEEEEGLLYNAVPAQVEEKAAELSDPQVRIWGMLSMSRLVQLGKRLAKLPGCEVLGELGWAVNMICKSMQTPPSQEDYQKLMELCNQIYELDGKEVFWCGEIGTAGKPFQVFDLNGMMGVQLEINDYIDNHLRLIAALSQGAEEQPAAESGMIGCTLLPDYYIRTGAGRLEEVPQIQAELERIWSDYEFVSSGITWEQVESRLAAYEELDILQP